MSDSICEDREPKAVLAIDCSADMLAVAVGKLSFDGEHYSVDVLATGDHLCRRQANVELTHTVLDTLQAAGIAQKDLAAVFVGRGPGSFTGVRIGIATAKGIACALTKPLFGVSTLDAVAWHVWEAGIRGKLAVVADAMRGEVYPGIYTLDEHGVVREFVNERVLKAKAAAEELASRADAHELILTGDGLKKHRATFEEAGLRVFLAENVWYASGEGLLKAAIAEAQVSGSFGSGDPALVLPVYTRLSDAEEAERARLGLKGLKATPQTGVSEALAGAHCQLRPMSVNDLEQVAALEKKVYVGSLHTPWTQDAFAEELTGAGRSWWVAHDRGTIIAFGGAMLAGDDLEILNIAVDPAYRRQKIARRLFARLSYDGHVLNAHTISLEVDVENEPAKTLYKALGFEQVGVRPKYYGNKNDALIMQTTLPLDAEKLGIDGDIAPRASIRPWPIVPQKRTSEQLAALDVAKPLILAIESSCDETAMAIIDAKGEICANVVATSIDFHARFGGVVPEIASRKHVEAIVGVFEECMAQAGSHFGLDTLAPTDLNAVGVTTGPGLVGALVVGVAFAKGLSAAAGIPLIPVHHLEGHLLANLFETPDLRPPFVASLVSGGNTMLVHVAAWGDYKILGQTIDDAVGEAFDKVAKALGLGYPGGPIISKLAAKGNRKAIHFPRAMAHSGDYNFSLSGLKTAVITYIEAENRAGRPINLEDLAASFEAAVVDVQVQKALRAVEETGVDEFCVGGGVAANPELRSEYKKHFGKRGVRVTVPPMVVCGDNAAMIALGALRNFEAGVVADLSLDADPNAQLGEWSSTLEPKVNDSWPPKAATKM